MLRTHITLLTFMFTACAPVGVFAETVDIVQINNESQSPVTIGDALRHQVIAAVQEEIVKRPINIPFSSAKDHWDDFVSDTPYIPNNALTVTTCGGTFALWRDETGIVCARQYAPGTCSAEECKPQSLYSAKHLAQVMSFLLLIDKHGTLALRKTASPNMRTAVATRYVR